jgi:hypothetical protein
VRERVIFGESVFRFPKPPTIFVARRACYPVASWHPAHFPAPKVSCPFVRGRWVDRAGRFARILSVFWVCGRVGRHECSQGDGSDRTVGRCIQRIRDGFAGVVFVVVPCCKALCLERASCVTRGVTRPAGRITPGTRNSHLFKSVDRTRTQCRRGASKSKRFATPTKQRPRVRVEFRVACPRWDRRRHVYACLRRRSRSV